MSSGTGRRMTWLGVSATPFGLYGPTISTLPFLLTDLVPSSRAVRPSMAERDSPVRGERQFVQ